MLPYAHAHGFQTVASGDFSYADGYQTVASAEYATSFGIRTLASGRYSVAMGQLTTASADNAHAHGFNTDAIGNGSHAEGQYTTASGNYSHAEGRETYALGVGSHAEGFDTSAEDDYTHAEGYRTVAVGNYSHAEGYQTTTLFQGSHTEGRFTTASANYAHAEGDGSVAAGSNSHAEGIYTLAIGYGAHSEGRYTTASANYSHAEGIFTETYGLYSHAEGDSTTAKGDYSHASGRGTISSGSAQNVVGYYNTHGDNTSFFIIGDGASDSARSDVFKAKSNLIEISGSVYIHNSSSNQSLIELGRGRTANGIAYIDFTAASSSTDYDLRIIRNSSPSGSTVLAHRGTGNLNFATQDDASIQFITLDTNVRMFISSSGRVGIGTTTPGYQLELSTDSAGKPGAGGLWTVTSDIRLKDNIQEANYDTCYDIVKNLPLKRYTWKSDAYTTQQIADRTVLGWIAQDVQPIFPKAVESRSFSGSGDFYIDDCLSLDAGQINAALYGAVKKLIVENESLKSELQTIKTHLGL